MVTARKEFASRLLGAPVVLAAMQDTLIVNQERRLEDVIHHWSQGSPAVNLMLTER
jgi:hypothetical protein